MPQCGRALPDRLCALRCDLRLLPRRYPGAVARGDRCNRRGPSVRRSSRASPEQIRARCGRCHRHRPRGRTGPRRREWQVARLAHELSQPAAQPRSRGDDLSGRSSPRSLLRRVEDRQSFAKARGGRRGHPMPSLDRPPRHSSLRPLLRPRSRLGDANPARRC